jgi:hypothetical protein
VEVLVRMGSNRVLLTGLDEARVQVKGEVAWLWPNRRASFAGRCVREDGSAVEAAWRLRWQGGEGPLRANGIEVGPKLASQEEQPPPGAADDPRGDREGKAPCPKDLRNNQARLSSRRWVPCLRLRRHSTQLQLVLLEPLCGVLTNRLLDIIARCARPMPLCLRRTQVILSEIEKIEIQ